MAKEVQTVHYLDAYPGVGKTAIAVDLMIRSIDKVCIYVAPRHVLLEEVYKRLYERASQLLAKGRITQEAYNDFVKEGKNRRLVVHINEKKAAEAGRTVGQYLEDRVNLSRPGDIVLCTHENFVRNGNFDYDYSKLLVVFDEARKMVLERRDQRIAVTDRQKVALFRAFEPYRHPIFLRDDQDRKKYSGFSRYSAPESDQNHILREARDMLYDMNVEETYGVDTSPSSAFQALVSDMCNPRLDVYLRLPLKLDDLLREEPQFDEKLKGVTKKQSVFQVVSPAKMFERFGFVLVMSAYFRHSQIYHLLKNYDRIHPEQNRIFDLVPYKISAQHQARMDEKRELIESRFRSVRIYPLLSKDQKVSMTNLELSCIVPRDRLESMYQELEKNGIRRDQVAGILRGRIGNKGKGSVQKAKMIKSAASRAFGNPLPEDDEAHKTFRRQGFAHPVSGYFHLAQYVVYFITQKADARKERNAIAGIPLISMNKKHLEEMANEGMRIPSGESTRVRQMITEPPREELERELAKALTYQQRVVLSGRGPYDMPFNLVMPDPLGLNIYRDRNFIAYLSARNPTPDVVSLFKVLIPEYSVDDDYAGDSAVQAVTRLSVRDQAASERVFIVVPDIGLARILQRKLRPYDRYGQIVEGGEGAQIKEFFAKRLDYVDVMTESMKELSGTSHERSTLTQKEAYMNEFNVWPVDIQRAHLELAKPEDAENWRSIRKRGVVSDAMTEMAVRKLRAYDLFLDRAFQEERVHPEWKFLRKILTERLRPRTIASYKKIQDELTKRRVYYRRDWTLR